LSQAPKNDYKVTPTTESVKNQTGQIVLLDTGNKPGCNVDKCKTKKLLRQKFPLPTAGQKQESLYTAFLNTHYYGDEKPIHRKEDLILFLKFSSLTP